MNHPCNHQGSHQCSTLLNILLAIIYLSHEFGHGSIDILECLTLAFLLLPFWEGVGGYVFLRTSISFSKPKIVNLLVVPWFDNFTLFLFCYYQLFFFTTICPKSEDLIFHYLFHLGEYLKHQEVVLGKISIHMKKIALKR